MSKEDIAPLEFYLSDLVDSMSVFDTDKNNKKEIRAMLDVWRNDVKVAHSILEDLMNK